ncbi:hypothetical protein GA0070619_1021 [Micromonospora zamorensis]|nr:hypothetical protein GA0070619_1021 [Micromonospora zamorensis]
MDATDRACEARAAPFDTACQAVPVDADSGIVAIEDPLDDRGERSRRVVLRVGTVGDPGPAPRVPGRRRPWDSPASRLLSTPQGGVLLRTLKDHVACPLQFVSGTHERVEIVGETAWDTGGDDQVVPGGAESVRGTVQSALPQCVKPALRRERGVADAARLRREAGHGANDGALRGTARPRFGARTNHNAGRDGSHREALTCAHSPARQHRELSTAVQNRRAFRGETGRHTHSDLGERGAAGRGGRS